MSQADSRERPAHTPSTPPSDGDLYAAKMGDLIVDSAWATCVGQCISFVCHLDGTPADKQCERLYISRDRFDQHIAPYLRELATLRHRLNCIAQFDRETVALAEERGRLSAQSEIAPIPDLAMLLREAVLKIELYAQNVGNVYIGGAPNQNLLPRLRAAAEKLEGK